MLNVINKFKNEILLTTFVFIFSIFINRSITFKSHSLGENLKLYSQIFPDTTGVLQPHRVLLPLIGNLLNLDVQILNLVFYILFIFLLIVHLTKVSSYQKTFFFVTSLSTTMVLQFHLNFGGYPDILSYLLLLMVYVFKDKKLLPYLLFFLALLAKETSIFTFLFFLPLRNISKIKLSYASIAYLPLYFYLNVGIYNYQFYLNPLKTDLFYWMKLNSENLLLGYFSSIKFLWILIFYFCFTNLNRKSLPLFYLFLGIYLQFFLGGDTTRFVSFLFLGLVYIFENSEMEFSNIVYGTITLLNIISPKYYVFAKGGSLDNLLLVNSNRIEILEIDIFLKFINSLFS